MAFQPGKTFVNLPIRDLKKTMAFFGEIGFEFNAQFTDENATCMIVNENTFVMLLVEDFFKTFIKKEIADATKTTEVIMGIAVDSREQVDEVVDKALAAGGKRSNDPVDHGFMYTCSFEDIDGHLWEVFYMDPGTVEQG